MKMTILELECKNIRKITSLKLVFHKDNNIINNNFIMMANGTGKTTIIQLIKGLLDKSAGSWDSDRVKEFAPSTGYSEEGEFSLTVKFDENQYKYILLFDFIKNVAQIKTVLLPKGREDGLRLPEALKGIFTSEFVSRFVFDGEQAQKSMDRTSNEAEETIKYLYRLDELDEILGMNEKILTDAQSAAGNRSGDKKSVSALRKKIEKRKQIIAQLETRRSELTTQLRECNEKLAEREAAINEHYKRYEDLDKKKNELKQEQEKNTAEINNQIRDILTFIKSPHIIIREFSERMLELGKSMQKLKLPKSSSKDFFIELAHSDKCVCNRCIGEEERKAILKNAERYLGGDKQAVLNILKSGLKDCKYDVSIAEAFVRLAKLREESNKIYAKISANEDKLGKVGGSDVKKLQDERDELNQRIGSIQSELKQIESKDNDDETLNEKNNLMRAKRDLADYEEKLVATTKTNEVLRKKKIVETLIEDVKARATDALKSDIIRKTNEKIKTVITDDNIEIENIDRYIKLRDRNGASEGQTLSIAYCFLGTLFEEAELEFPFIIDSPTGKMDLDKRKAVAEIIPNVFNQLIAFVQSSEVDKFADRFYDNADAQFITVIASKDGGDVELHMGKEYFDKYQNEHKGDDE